MKKRYIIYIICGFILSANQVHALTYKDSFGETQAGTILSASAISEAKLLQSYVIRYENKINTLYYQYRKQTSDTMGDAEEILTLMSQALEKIQNSHFQEKDDVEIMKSIVKDLKILNQKMKEYLEKIQKEHNNKILSLTKRYERVGEKISDILDALIARTSKTLISKEKLSTEEKRIVQSLVNIRNENEKIKAFSSLSFNSEDEIKDYFKTIITNIRSEINAIKGLSH